MVDLDIFLLNFSPYDLHGIVGRLYELYLVWSWIRTGHTGTHLYTSLQVEIVHVIVSKLRPNGLPNVNPAGDHVRHGGRM